MAAELLARVVERLVERAASGAHAIGEHVDRHAVQGERDEHASLVGGEHLGDGTLQGLEQLALFELALSLDPPRG